MAASRSRLTNNSDETDLTTLLSGDTVFAIPYFQRAYKWKPERLQQLNRDLLSIVDETTDFHFLGAVIIHGRRSNPSDPKVYDVIDGQQRITTIFLYLCAIVRVLARIGEISEAAALFLKFLVIARPTTLMSNVKLQSCKDDRAQLNGVMRDLLSEEAFAAALTPFQFKPLPATGEDRGRLRNNYRAAVRFFDDQFRSEGLKRIRDLYTGLLEFMSVVQIDVFDPTNGPKIFDSLNSRQEPMTTGDLVRNEIFSRIAAEHPDSIENMDQRSWQPFYNKFRADDKSLFDAYFFPYGLIQDPNLRKSEVYAKLRENWREVTDPEEIVRALAQYQDAFLDLECGTNRQSHPKEVARGLEKLRSANAPASTYPFLMRLSNGIKDGVVSAEDGVGVLHVVESFLVRRAVCGHEPTGLHAVFKRLWNDCGGVPNALSVSGAIRKHKTVVWPDDRSVVESVNMRPLYGSSITRHLLLEWNRSLGGDQPNDLPWIEHVLPVSPSSEWLGIFTEDQHLEMKDLLANLLPLSHEMNQSLGNRPYAEKKGAYAEDSGYKAARRFAADVSEWTPDALRARSAMLGRWILEHWPY